MRVTGSWTRILLDWLDQCGCSAPSLRAALLALPPGEAVSVSRWRELLDQAAGLQPASGPELGLTIGARVQTEHVGVLGYLVASSATLGEALLAYQRYETLFYGTTIAEAHWEGSSVEIRWPPTTLGPIADAIGIAALYAFIQRHLSQPLRLEKVAFIHPVPTHAEAFERYFDCPVHFSDTHTRVRFAASQLATPMRQGDSSLKALLDRQARAALSAMPDSAGFDEAIRSCILRGLPEGRVTLPEVAASLHRSVRTLQRRLSQRNLVWRDLLDRVRLSLAQEYLMDASLALSDIALLLGYTEQSAFTRAFKRWTGTTPARWRQLGQP